MLFHRKEKKTFDPAARQPMLHKSICTGETAAGFRELATGKFTEEMLIRSPEDLKAFMDTYGLKEVPPTEY